MGVQERAEKTSSDTVGFAFCRSHHLSAQRNGYPWGRVQVNNACFVWIYLCRDQTVWHSIVCVSLGSKYCPAGCLTSTEEISGTIPNGYREVSVNNLRTFIYSMCFLFVAVLNTFPGESWCPVVSCCLVTMPTVTPQEQLVFAYSCFHGLSLPPPISVLLVCTSFRLIHWDPLFSSLCKRAPALWTCESWTDDLTAPPLHVRSWVPSLWLMTSCSELGVCWGERREWGVVAGWLENREEIWGVLQGARCPTGTEEGQGQRVKGRWDNSLDENNNPLIQSSCERVLSGAVCRVCVLERQKAREWVSVSEELEKTCVCVCKWLIHAFSRCVCVCVSVSLGCNILIGEAYLGISRPNQSSPPQVTFSCFNPFQRFLI